ncbi:hypothetical protein ABIE45_005585 [Methylobacterium sp. OAE515]
MNPGDIADAEGRIWLADMGGKAGSGQIIVTPAQAERARLFGWVRSSAAEVDGLLVIERSEGLATAERPAPAPLSSRRR